MPHGPRLPTWQHSDRFLARNLGRPALRFLHVEAAGGLLLLAGTVVALVWANSPWSASYDVAVGHQARRRHRRPCPGRRTSATGSTTG